MKFAGRTIIVTGAGSGLGECLALQLGRKGATVACVDRNEALLARVIERLEKESTRCSAHLADIADAEAVAKLVAAVDRGHGGFDGLINNAGIMQSFTAVSDLAIEDIERITRVNYWGMVMLVKASLPILERRPASLIVNISSLGALVPYPGQTAYGASKAAVRIFTEGLRMETEGSGIEVAVVMPGAIRTGIVENSPFYSEQQKARMRERFEGRGFAQDPERAARRILTAVEKGRHRILVGPDAWLLDKLYRVAPIATSRLLRWGSRFIPAIE
jgi:short-subunit dehydrogenase